MMKKLESKKDAILQMGLHRTFSPYGHFDRKCLLLYPDEREKVGFRGKKVWKEREIGIFIGQNDTENHRLVYYFVHIVFLFREQ